MTEYKEGTFTARVSTYGVQRSKAGAPLAVIVFAFKDDAGEKRITWYGSFAEKAAKWTIKTLLLCGLGTNPLDAIADGPAGGALDQQREVDIVLQKETYEGKTRVKVAFVNAVGSGGGASLKEKDRVDRNEAQFLLKDESLRAELLEARKEFANLAPPAGRTGTVYRPPAEAQGSFNNEFNPNFGEI